MKIGRVKKAIKIVIIILTKNIGHVNITLTLMLTISILNKRSKMEWLNLATGTKAYTDYEIFPRCESA
jgi:hypothetical protein